MKFEAKAENAARELKESNEAVAEALLKPAVKRTGNPDLDMALELEAMPQNPDWPADGAAQHDYYLYGMPKR